MDYMTEVKEGSSGDEAREEQMKRRSRDVYDDDASATQLYHENQEREKTRTEEVIHSKHK